MASPSAPPALLAIAALLKSAQFPTHGWLTEVMETPTPVSALLHAGVINAGGFLLIRFADVMLLAPGVLAALVMIGGFTALFGSLVMLTQPAVKTSLAWSTVAQMGFMIFECGLALFPLALLHIVAHSLYKAHSFLASGGAVEQVAAIPRPGPVAVPEAGAVGAGLPVGARRSMSWSGLAFGFQHNRRRPSRWGHPDLRRRLHAGARFRRCGAPGADPPHGLLRPGDLGQLLRPSGRATASPPPSCRRPPPPGPLEWALIVLAVLQLRPGRHRAGDVPALGLAPCRRRPARHLSNGLDANAIFDRLLGGWSRPRPS